MQEYYVIKLDSEYWTGEKYQYRGYPYAVLTDELSEAKVFNSFGIANRSLEVLNNKTGQSLLWNFQFEIKTVTENDLLPEQIKRGHCWAIYRNTETGGLYAAEYVDDIKQVKGKPIEYNIKKYPEDLPYVLNSFGAGCPFSLSDLNFVEFRKWNRGKNPLSLEERYPVNDPNFQYGWISPQGTTYHCGYYGHMDCADLLAETFYSVQNPIAGDHILLNHGWLKTTHGSGNGINVFGNDSFLSRWTEAQKDIVRKIDPDNRALAYQEGIE